MTDEGSEGLSYLLGPRGGVSQIGRERGRSVHNGIARFTSREGSIRYVMYEAGAPIAALQMMVGHTPIAIAANVYTAPGHRRRGLARLLLERARRDLGAIEFSSHLSAMGRAWKDAMKKNRKRPFAFAHHRDLPRRAFQSLLSSGWKVVQQHDAPPNFGDQAVVRQLSDMTKVAVSAIDRGLVDGVTYHAAQKRLVFSPVGLRSLYEVMSQVAWPTRTYPKQVISDAQDEIAILLEPFKRLPDFALEPVVQANRGRPRRRTSRIRA